MVIQSLFLILVSGLLFVVVVLTSCASSHVRSFPSRIHLVTNATGEGRTEWLFGLLSYPSSQDPIILSSGHLAYMGLKHPFVPFWDSILEQPKTISNGYQFYISIDHRFAHRTGWICSQGCIQFTDPA